MWDTPIKDARHIKERADFGKLSKWLLLTSMRTPLGKQALSQRICELASTSLAQWEKFCDDNKITVNYFLYKAYETGIFTSGSKDITDFRKYHWTVRKVAQGEEVICSDNPYAKIANSATMARMNFVPLCPRKLLIWYESGRPNNADKKMVGTVNSLLLELARRFVFSRTQDIYFAPVEIVKRPEI